MNQVLLGPRHRQMSLSVIRFRNLSQQLEGSEYFKENRISIFGYPNEIVFEEKHK